jgi:NAD(P)-dependent dehydrogenase (short-subunit alcohol dehydrogenase family)
VRRQRRRTEDEDVGNDEAATPPSAGLAGRVALVTGGGRGLGPQLARALARAGAAVAVAARTLSELESTVSAIEAGGGKALALVADVTSHGEVQEAVDAAESELGPIDVLVNNAGRFQAIGPTWEVDPDDWWREFEVNVRGAALCTTAVVGGMLRRGAGRIVNVASGAATVPLPGASAYGAGKTALLRLTETLSRELDGTGVHVFAIDPGVLRTPMNEALLRDRTEVLTRWAPWFLDVFAGGREDSPELAARLVVLLAEGRADALSGRLLSIRDDVDGLLDGLDETGREDFLTLRLLNGR